MLPKNTQVYTCRASLIPGHNYATVAKIARKIFNEIKGKTKRRPYIRSAYFKNEKIFFDNFWPHLNQKYHVDQLRRLKYFDCAIELIQKSHIMPSVEFVSNKERLYRFNGISNGRYFALQIKEDLKRHQKFLMSVFPI